MDDDFASFVARARPSLVHLARSLGRDDDAEDVVHTALARVPDVHWHPETGPDRRLRVPGKQGSYELHTKTSFCWITKENFHAIS